MLDVLYRSTQNQALNPSNGIVEASIQDLGMAQIRILMFSGLF